MAFVFECRAKCVNNTCGACNIAQISINQFGICTKINSKPQTHVNTEPNGETK